MNISGLNAATSRLLSSIAQTDTDEVAKRVIASNDLDGDGALSIAELGVDSDEFSATDTNGDGVVSREELVARISARLGELTNTVLGSSEDEVGLSTLKNLFEVLSAESEEQSSYNTIMNLLTELGVSSEDTSSLISLLEENGIDVTA